MVYLSEQLAELAQFSCVSSSRDTFNQLSHPYNMLERNAALNTVTVMLFSDGEKSTNVPYCVYRINGYVYIMIISSLLSDAK